MRAAGCGGAFPSGRTNLAGQATNAAVVLDWSKYCHRLIEVNVEARTCIVEPGIVLDALNDRLRDTGLRFGPEPATHDCALGEMIGNKLLRCHSPTHRQGGGQHLPARNSAVRPNKIMGRRNPDEDYDRIVAAAGLLAAAFHEARQQIASALARDVAVWMHGFLSVIVWEDGRSDCPEEG